MPSKFGHFISLALTLLILAACLIPIVEFTPSARALLLYDSGNPTPDEQLVLEMVNRARSNPIAEGQRLGIDIHEGLQNPSLVGPRPPLAFNKLLLGIAEAHSREMYNGNYFSHTDPNGTTAFDRMTHAGYNFARAGENMAAGTDIGSVDLEDFMMVDSGTQGRLHRVNLLDIFPYPCGDPPCAYSEIGIGYYEGSTSNSVGNAFITEDFGATISTGPLLTGVVYNDRNGNNFYDIGEGLAGITVTPSSGSYYAISSSSGGYAFPIGSSGMITVTASGPGFGPITKTVTLTGTNIELDLTPQTSSSSTLSQTITQTTTQPTTQSSQTFTQTFSTTAQPQFASIQFLTTPSSFVGAASPGTITACGNTYSNSQTAPNCSGGTFSATANLPSPSSGWEFNNWAWTGGVACSSDTANPVSCSASSSGGVLMAVYAALVNVATNPASTAQLAWGSCSNPPLGNGNAFFSTNYGSTTITTCQLPSGYSFSSWTCSGGLTCSASANPTTLTLNGPGTITLNLQAQTIDQTSTTTSTSLSSTTSMQSTSSISTTSTVAQPAPEFDIQTMLLGAMLVAALLIITTSSRGRPSLGRKVRKLFVRIREHKNADGNLSVLG